MQILCKCIKALSIISWEWYNSINKKWLLMTDVKDLYCILSFLSRFRDCIFLPLNFNGKETHVLHSYFEKRNMKSTRGSKFDLCEEYCDLAY